MPISKRYLNQINHCFSKEIKLEIIISTRWEHLAWKFKTNIFCPHVVIKLLNCHLNRSTVKVNLHLQTFGCNPESLHQVFLIFSQQIWLPPVCSFQLPHFQLKGRRSCAAASLSEAARKVSIIDRVRCHNHHWNMRCLNKEINAGWYHCSCVEDLESEYDDGRALALLTKQYIC